jgi:hypothetical protein
MRTVMVDGREVMVDDEMTGERISELARPSNDQFAVVVRNNGNLPVRIPIPKSSHPYRLNDGDVITNMYRVPTGA